MKDVSKTRQRGAALILVVIVIMVLTTLGIIMVTFTTTEERSAATYRDSLQARSVAEAGVRVVQQIFKNPNDTTLVPVYDPSQTAAGTGYDYWGASEADVDAALATIGIWRRARAGANPSKYLGGGGVRFFQGPFQSDWRGVFYGNYSPDNATDMFDLKLNCRNPDNPSSVVASSACWLDAKINTLLADNGGNANLDTGRITDISFYRPPVEGGESYGIVTFRVTAEKRISYPNGALLARETIVAVIGDGTPKPAVFGNGVVKIGAGGSGNGTLCGDGCLAIHGNGNVYVGSIGSGAGEDPLVTSYGGTITGSSSTQIYSSALESPEINPWDLTYRPSTTSELSKYYLLAARPLDAVWTTGGTGNNPAARPCGNNQLSRCQDYQLEYEAPPSTTAKAARSATGTPSMYKWDEGAGDWVFCDSTPPLSCGAGTPTFSVTMANDSVVSGTGDNADLPYNVTRVPQTIFEIQSAQNDATVLVDGQFAKHGNMVARMSVIAAGTIQLHSQTTWQPAMSTKAMWITGRDLKMHSNCCASSNSCTVNASESGILACHEQLDGHSNSSSAGVVMSENRVNYDTVVNSTTAIDWTSDTHGYMCDEPRWPWTLPITPILLSMQSAGN